ncbi:flagellar biosynthesis protein FlhF [Alteribacter aurantiacus]|uniref:flagellar biosynthesis protein FlhF n=1 Tax=Alteribacter aurantiacus TaxID=254410 RepID=UPI0004166D33|nr:flagellar biosynthesis protein FlhF [Alteribacter aurantiacus]
MKVKKIQACDMPEALNRIKQELGPDAVILHSRTIEKGGFFGFLTKKQLEVIAAVDPEPTIHKEKKKQPAVIPSNRVEKTNKDQRSIKHTILPLSPKGLPNHTGGPLEKMNHLFYLEGLSEDLKGRVMGEVTKRWYKEDSPEFIDDVSWFKDAMEQVIPEQSFTGTPNRKKFISLVGPTGVGKTTTLAKMASYTLLKEKKSIGFITSDTYRIGAVEQLKTYARILNVPIEVVYTLDDFKKAQQTLADKDAVFIDTAGRNYQDGDFIDQLRHTIDLSEDVETHLVLSLTSKYEDMKLIINQFKKLEPEFVIFTKWDETSSHGSIANVLSDFHLKPSYITTGQDVPDDIQLAKKNSIIDQMAGKYYGS